jgi:hypothetical protein
MEQRRRLFEEWSGETCHVRHYSDFRHEEVAAPDVSAVVTSGNRSLWSITIWTGTSLNCRRDWGDAKPVLGICAVIN